MKILDRYISREFLKMFVFGIIALVLVSTVVDIFERVDDIVEYKPPFSVTITFFLARIPLVLFMITPISILLTTLLVTGRFARNSEIIAMLAGGVSIYRLMAPLLVIGFVMSVLMLGLNEFVVPTANQITEECKRIMKQKPDTRQMAKIQIWFRGNENNRIYYINALIPEKLGIQGLTVFELNDQFLPIKRLDAEQARYHPPKNKNEQPSEGWKKFLPKNPLDFFFSPENGEVAEENLGTWTLYQGAERSLEPGQHQSIIQFQRRRDYVIPHSFEEFRRDTKKPEDMNYRELARYIQTLTASGYDMSEYIVDLRAKLSYPFVSLVMVIIGFPFALKSPRSGAAFGVGLSVFIGLTYWIILQMAISLGHAHILPPLLAAWISHIIFASAGFYLVLSTRT
ncbi:permease [Candidatus Vecturithrix granuli]|uniref:Permease n=1 Tax=Vecturithrix granuli TaxID=1499967 RepID=A0A081C3U4_VECG1|nr:permease [Candidatus Vecturithrix granuli]